MIASFIMTTLDGFFDGPAWCCGRSTGTTRLKARREFGNGNVLLTYARR